MLWVVFAVLIAAAAAVLALSALRARAATATRADHDLTVYRDQLREIDADVARGVLQEAEAGAARVEVQRRMLVAGATAQGPQSRETPSLRWAAVIVALVAMPAIALPVYLWRGNPAIPGQPLASRGGAAPGADHANAGGAMGLEDAIKRLQARLAANPEDAEGWRLLGRSYMMTQNPEPAIDAYRRALALTPDEAQLHSALAESLTFAAGGTVTEEARQEFEIALARDPRDPAGRFYLSLAKAQAGRTREAFDGWLALLGDTPADAPWLPVVRRQIEDAAKQLNVDLASVLPKTAPIESVRAPVLPPIAQSDGARAGAAPQAPRGPTQDDIRNAQGMSDADRQTMIRGMVASLVARLEENPDDIEGWQRLARSYEVLGESERAREAQARVAALQARGPGARPAPAAPSPQASAPATPRGPTPEDVRNAQGLPPGDQQAMIRGMVDGLAARLKDNPNDREGWLRLGRSYAVLNRQTESLDAYARAASLWPEDSEVLQLYARALYEARPSTTGPLPDRIGNLYRRILEKQGNNLEALYFVGLAEVERGNAEEGARLWGRLLAALDPKSDAHAEMTKRLEALKAPTPPK